jgi:hypothetical protein
MLCLRVRLNRHYNSRGGRVRGLDAQKIMIRFTLRCLSVVLAVAAVGYDWFHGRHPLMAIILCGTACLIIWFPDVVDDVTFGTTRAGYQIDSHTPPWLIEIAGWVLLLLHVSVRFFPNWIGHAFGM